MRRVLVMGGPSWYGPERYDVVAKTQSGNVAAAQVRFMHQRLLQERFKLTVQDGPTVKDIAGLTGLYDDESDWFPDPSG